MKKFLLLFTLLLALGGAWWLGRHGPSLPGASHAGHDSAAAPAERKLLYYQSTMHPWVKSDKPGKCTICGMDLSPVYESGPGDATPASATSNADPSIVLLPAGSPQIAGIATSEVKRLPLTRTLRVSGRIDDDETRHRVLAATIKGRIDELHASYNGAEVTEGQPLAEFFSRELLAAVAEYNFSVAQKSPLVDSVAQRLRQMGLTDAQITALPKRDPKSLTVELLSPMTGTVVAKDVYEGKWVEEGQRLFELADFSTMWFLFDVYEQDLPWLKVGQTVDVRTPSHPGQVFQAKITFIDPSLDAMSRTAKVRAELANPLIEENGVKRRTLLHRLYAEGTVHTTAPETLLAPRDSIIWPGGTPRVFVEQGAGSYQMRQVTLGRTGDSHVEVTAGLKEGEKVVTRGGVLLDGQLQLNNPHAEPGHDGHDPSGEPEATLAGKILAQQKTCPVSNAKLDSMGGPFVFTHEGHKIGLCCGACQEDFDEAPMKYMAKLGIH